MAQESLERLCALACARLAFGARAGPDDPAGRQDKDKDDLLMTSSSRRGEPNEATSRPRNRPTRPIPPDETKPSGEVATKDKDLDRPPRSSARPEDQALDDRLESWVNRRTLTPRRAPLGPGPRPDKANDGQEGRRRRTGGKDKDLDEHLEELPAGGRRTSDPSKEARWPDRQVIKEMREVEQRLGKSDTGEATRRSRSRSSRGSKP